MTKKVYSFRIDERELSFYKNVAEDEMLPLTDIILIALRKTYKPPLEHNWVCSICGRSQTANSKDDCIGETIEELDDVEDAS